MYGVRQTLHNPLKIAGIFNHLPAFVFFINCHFRHHFNLIFIQQLIHLTASHISVSISYFCLIVYYYLRVTAIRGYNNSYPSAFCRKSSVCVGRKIIAPHLSVLVRKQSGKHRLNPAVECAASLLDIDNGYIRLCDDFSIICIIFFCIHKHWNNAV